MPRGPESCLVLPDTRCVAEMPRPGLSGIVCVASQDPPCQTADSLLLLVHCVTGIVQLCSCSVSWLWIQGHPGAK